VKKVWRKSCVREGGCFSSILKYGPLRERNPLIFNPLFLFLILLFLPLTFSVCVQEEKGNRIIEQKDVFALVDEAEGVSYVIKDRKSLDRQEYHRILFQVEVSNTLPPTKLKALAQKIVKDTIKREKCHGISLDFGPYGYADFAPYGNWNKSDEKLEVDYNNYRFTYVFY
jgi:hypothetical protein